MHNGDLRVGAVAFLIPRYGVKRNWAGRCLAERSKTDAPLEGG